MKQLRLAEREREDLVRMIRDTKEWFEEKGDRRKLFPLFWRAKLENAASPMDALEGYLVECEIRDAVRDLWEQGTACLTFEVLSAPDPAAHEWKASFLCTLLNERAHLSDETFTLFSRTAHESTLSRGEHIPVNSDITDEAYSKKLAEDCLKKWLCRFQDDIEVILHEAGSQ